ncbi:type I-E CRISPR-associated protein Cse1/CasA [Donghicola mangrovi]|uniref:Type I-E CRISPR-associated protein Cse1/CasA n=1 Tax=Donghicola mangrovi TaxID=2729614 RepID=A0A850Q8I0_9RHOB|nr:type I-E CRISPR-associated protein Cse1/CasA [Donghicola mangrovi]NVO23050.1 type I-E CRISPR-associated protein Cse1/CasA [Donghicola mangrovi]
MNLITDAWIPVVDTTGARRVIAPWQMADTNILRPDWPRADLNIACLELLIGLVFLADPPEDIDDWGDRQVPDPERLRERLEVFAPAFNLVGDGPLFLQDFEDLGSDAKSPDMLFIDSSGGNTAKNNADLMVHRDRYQGLDLPLAAMALFTFQAHAPAGGAGNRTSMRGGGPMVTLVDPKEGLWSLVWANVPYGEAGELNDLPWMKPTRVSDHPSKTVEPPQGGKFDVEAFFGMPRRLRLICEENLVTGVVQKKNGNNYGIWMHPLSPYYRVKAGEQALPVHPRAGSFGYRQFLGILAKSKDSELAMRAACVAGWEERGYSLEKKADVIVAGWSMDNMKPRDFIHSVHPFLKLSEEGALILSGMVEAADKVAVSLRSSLATLLSEGEAREAEREVFFRETEPAFLDLVQQLIADENAAVGPQWIKILRTQALGQFDRHALPGMDQRSAQDIQAIVGARKSLGLTLSGYGKMGADAFTALGLPLPAKSKKQGKAA